LVFLQKLERLSEHEPQEGQVLVNPVIVNFVPVHVENECESLEPLLFVLMVVNLHHNTRNLLAALLLVLWFIRMPNHVEQTLPSSPDVLD